MNMPNPNAQPPLPLRIIATQRRLTALQSQSAVLNDRVAQLAPQVVETERLISNLEERAHTLHGDHRKAVISEIGELALRTAKCQRELAEIEDERMKLNEQMLPLRREEMRLRADQAEAKLSAASNLLHQALEIVQRAKALL